MYIPHPASCSYNEESVIPPGYCNPKGNGTIIFSLVYLLKDNLLTGGRQIVGIKSDGGL